MYLYSNKFSSTSIEQLLSERMRSRYMVFINQLLPNSDIVICDKEITNFGIPSLLKY